MTGMQAIIQRYQLSVNAQGDHGLFEWRRRMGVHLAFHRQPGNIFLHATFSIVNAWALLLMVYPFTVPGISVAGVPIDGAMLMLAVVFCVYAAMEIGTALLLTGIYAATYPLCEVALQWFDGSAGMMVSLGVFLTAFALAVQVFIGHGISEEGIDDAVENFKELFESKNPIYFIALPFYTYLDLLFMMGYRPEQAKYIWDITDELRPKLEAELTARDSSKEPR